MDVEIGDIPLLFELDRGPGTLIILAFGTLL